MLRWLRVVVVLRLFSLATTTVPLRVQIPLCPSRKKIGGGGVGKMVKFSRPKAVLFHVSKLRKTIKVDTQRMRRKSRWEGVGEKY